MSLKGNPGWGISTLLVLVFYAALAVGGGLILGGFCGAFYAAFKAAFRLIAE